MKKILNFSLLTLIIFTAIQCTTPRTEMDKHWKNYTAAIGNGDVNTAIVEVNAIYAFDTTNQSVLDTLSRLYFISGNTYGTYNVSKKINNKSKEQKMIMAEAAFQMGLQSEAKNLFGELNDADTSGNNIGIKYKLATLHFADEEYEQAITLLNDVTLNENSTKQSTRVKMGENTYQDVSLYAASWNFAGYMQLLNGDFDTADKYFEEAIRAQPDFQLAANNMAQSAAAREEAKKAGK